MKLASLEGKSIYTVLQGLSARLRGLLARDIEPAVAHHGAASCKGAALANRFPMTVSCYGRRYVVNTHGEMNELLDWLNTRSLALANHYRVGASWPRGKCARRQPVVSRSLWPCRDCGRSHRQWTTSCPVSERTRDLAEAHI